MAGALYKTYFIDSGFALQSGGRTRGDRYTLMFIKNQRIITGGPGSGKSKLLRSLSAQGFLTSAEAERAIIWDRTATGGMLYRG
ncbi:AAA family ATPase [Pantoea sp. FN0307]|uniref:AAA family ATPase n=1 Tax=Pantoea sp. FN0307 TaxID=3418560 RepID=UPI003CEB3517